MRTSKVVSLSMPPEVAREFEDLARQQKRSKSELFRDMLYIWKKFSHERARQEHNHISAMVSRILAETEEEKRRGVSPTPEKLAAEWQSLMKDESVIRAQEKIKERGITEEMIIAGKYGDTR
ncbi:MAG TPA: ribbon-helix-helix protein, CopG family [Gammaproteobacteria bacterium]|nr:ribbon-helix-helix protein, CopG family [Gammaproteobacteria bacterium]